VYARRGGIQVYDSIVSANLVDGSGGALGSTGDILVVRSHMDGNTTDGDGGAIYTDEDGDVTVIDSTVSGSTADGPGGAIFTLDGDVTIVGSTLTGNRADDRGGAISGEATVTVINSTISRNLAVAHVGGGIWSRGDMYVGNSTVSDNYAEAKGGGLHAAGVLTLVDSTVADNIASVAPNIGVGERLDAFASVIGPAKVEFNGGQAQPAETSCDTPVSISLGFNVVTEGSCGLAAPTDLIGVLSGLAPLRGYGGPAETRLPQADSPALDRVPADACLSPPLPEPLEGEQHLAGLVDDVAALLRTDQRGVPRPQGPACDAGAVEVAR
jgi:predicted outer membrane repeat protein